MLKGLTLIFLCSIVIPGFAQDQDSRIESRKKEDPNSSEALVIVSENVEAVLEAKSLCFKKDDEMIEIYLCTYESIKKLAEEGNFIAQEAIGRMYLNKDEANLPMALRWLKKALENPKTPLAYKTLILEKAKEVEERIARSGLGEKEENELSDAIKEDMASIEKHQQIIEELKKEKLDKNPEFAIMLKNLDDIFTYQKPCYGLKEALDIRACILREIKNLADNGNFIAQHELGNIYENSFDNKAMAIKWYNAALKNPNTPKLYKPQVESDLNRVKLKTGSPPKRESEEKGFKQIRRKQTEK